MYGPDALHQGTTLVGPLSSRKSGLQAAEKTHALYQGRDYQKFES
jgi:hypothetical protein